MTSLLISCLPVHFCLFNFFSPNVLCNVYVYTQLLLFIKECVSLWFKIVFSQNKIGEMWVFGISVIHQQLTNKKKFTICKPTLAILLGLTNTAQRYPCIATSFILVALLISYWQLMLQNLVGLMLINMEVSLFTSFFVSLNEDMEYS